MFDIKRIVNTYKLCNIIEENSINSGAFGIPELPYFLEFEKGDYKIKLIEDWIYEKKIRKSQRNPEKLNY